MNHGLKINIISKNIYEKDKWPIDVNHSWILRIITNERSNLYNVCPIVKIKIHNMEVEQNFFVQNCGSYAIIFKQPYILTIRMETKILKDGSYYAKICSLDSKQAI